MGIETTLDYGLPYLMKVCQIFLVNREYEIGFRIPR